jgi:N-acetyltransferase
MSESFDFNKNYILEDDVALLRPLRQDDTQELLGFVSQEPDLWKYSLQQPRDESTLSHYIDLALEGKRQRKEYPFIVFDKRVQEYAGSTRYYDIQLDHQSLQLGYTWYGSDFQGTGLNKHCKYLLLTFAFENMGMARVEFRADQLNQKSIAAMKSIGCVEEGVLRSNFTKPDGTRRDSIVLSILRQEWFGNIKQQLKGRL